LITNIELIRWIQFSVSSQTVKKEQTARKGERLREVEGPERRGAEVTEYGVIIPNGVGLLVSDQDGGQLSTCRDSARGARTRSGTQAHP